MCDAGRDIHKLVDRLRGYQKTFEAYQNPQFERDMDEAAAVIEFLLRENEKFKAHQPKEHWETLNEAVDNLRAENEQLKAENARLNKENFWLSKDQSDIDANKRLADAVQTLRNELCQLCGKYREAHLGACDGCRWKEG